MKALIIYMSMHHGNTEKVAKRMAKALGADLMKAAEIADPALIKGYDLIGFGSGIYFGKYHRALDALADRLSGMGGKKAFLFSTSGASKGSFFNSMGAEGLGKKLRAKGFEIIGEFNCLAFDTYGLLGLTGGLNKGRPDERDLKAAEEFAKGLKEKVA